MNKIFILYPEEFHSQSKFDRKVGNITGNMQEYCFISANDKNQLIRNFVDTQEKKIEFIQNSDWENLAITHAIIFDDGEEFLSEITKIEAKNIPIRIIKILITRVVNIKKELKYSGAKSTPEYEYIGRGSKWGNPYSLFAEGGDLNEVIRKYKYDFDYDKSPNRKKDDVYMLAGKRLGCFCKPDPCHGDVLADFLNSWDDGK